jgi:hypothetical protein
MSEPIYKTMKVFDCQWNPGMPENVKKAFFDIFADRACNDVYVSYTIAESVWGGDEGQDYKLLDKWLIENGAEGLINDNVSGETVLIQHWW